MNVYSQFCVVYDKKGDFKSLGFKEKEPNVFTKGNFASSRVIGNVYSYQKDKGLNELEKGLEESPSNFLKDFVGDFSFVFFGKSIIAVRDHMGIFPLFYYNDSNMFVVSNDQRLMIDLPNINLQKDDQWIANYVGGFPGNFESTFYKYIKKVLPGHFLTYLNDEAKLTKYWQLDIKKRHPKKSDEDYIAEFRAILKEAVECRIPSDVKLGSEVSGGIDCTSIAAIAKAHIEGKNIDLYTYAHAAVDDNNPSEKPAIERFLKHLKPYKHTYAPIEMKGMCAVADPTFLLRNGISQSHYSLFSRDLYRAAKSDGVKVMLSGNGGDHCASYKGAVMVIQQMIVEGNFLKAWQELKFLHKTFFRTTYKFFTAIVNLWIASPFKNKEDISKLNKSIELGHLWLQKKYPESVQYFLPRSKPRKKYIPLRKAIFDRVNRGDLTLRGEHTTMAASEFDVLYRYPLLDIRLLQYTIALPPHLFFHNGMNRYIYREAIKPFVPLYLASQPKPPGNMYGWISEAYDYDKANNIKTSVIPTDEEMKLYVEWWNNRNEKFNFQN